MLTFALPIAKELGITNILVTCDDSSVGSIKTIEANGGILENTVLVEGTSSLKRRNWINTLGGGSPLMIISANPRGGKRR